MSEKNHDDIEVDLEIIVSPTLICGISKLVTDAGKSATSIAVSIKHLRPELDALYLIAEAALYSRRCTLSTQQVLADWLNIVRVGARLPFEPAIQLADAYTGAREDLQVAKRDAAIAQASVRELVAERDERRRDYERMQNGRDDWKRAAEMECRRANTADDKLQTLQAMHVEVSKERDNAVENFNRIRANRNHWREEAGKARSRVETLQDSVKVLQERNDRQRESLQQYSVDSQQLEGWKARALAAEDAVHRRLDGVSDDAILFALTAVRADHEIESLNARLIAMGRAVLALVAPAAGDDADGEALQALGVTGGEEQARAFTDGAAMPLSSAYSVEKHGRGWAIYQGRDGMHHGLNLGQLVETNGEVAALVEAGLNALQVQKGGRNED